MGRTLDNQVQGLGIVIGKPGVDAETGTQRGSEQAGTGCGTDERERVEADLHAAGIGTRIDHDVDFVVLHGRIQVFLYYGSKSVDFVDEQDIVGFEVGQKTGQLAGFVQNRSGSGLDAYAQFVGNDIGKCGFSQARRTVQENMVQGFLALAGCHDKDFEVADHAFLALEAVETGGSQGFFDFFIRSGKPGRIRVEQVVHCLRNMFLVAGTASGVSSRSGIAQDSIRGKSGRGAGRFQTGKGSKNPIEPRFVHKHFFRLRIAIFRTFAAVCRGADWI